MDFLKNHNKLPMVRFKWLSIVTIIFSIFLTLIIGASVGSVLTYKDKFLPNTKIGNINVSNRTQEQAQEIVNKLSKTLMNDGLIVKTNDNQSSFVVTSVLPSTDPDLSRTLFSVDPKATVVSAWNDQHQKLSFIFLTEAIANTLIGWRYNSVNTINNADISDTLKNVFSSTIANSKASTINFTTNPPTINPGTAGTEIDYDFFTNLISDHINDLDNSPIIIYNQKSPDPVDERDISFELQQKINYLASTSPEISIIFEDKKWPLAFASYRNWLTLIKNQNNETVINLDKDLTTPYWEEIKQTIDKPVQNARFSISNGRVEEFQSSKDGRKFNIDKTLELINDSFNTGEVKSVTAIVDIEKSTINNSEVNNLGITEIIGVGISNFKGSPKNRRHNIAVGAKSLNGVLIQPGQEFSLIKTLGAIDATNGYLQELVIKGNQTKPEFGGGLCQIGTTVFRATLSSGLPILERRNHTYRVVYYEPAGTDATIYDPKPDFRFKNDTGSYILMQSHISGDDLVIEFWGTKDGRKVEQSKPVISNIVQPGEPEMIETDELKPGETKCIETPHAGADVYFDYKVTYANGEEKGQRFSSHYIPWTKKCLVGRTASSTPSNISSTSTPSTTPSTSTPPAN